MIKCLLVMCVVLACGTNGQKSSPCPNVFHYDNSNYQGRWDGQIRLQTDEELSGVFVTILLDRTAESLGNWFGETVTRDNKEFTIKNNEYILVPGINVTLKFYVEFNDIYIPSVTTIRLNGRTICSETKKAKPIPSQPPFTSIKISPKTTTTRYVTPSTTNYPDSEYRDTNHYGQPSQQATTEQNIDTLIDNIFRPQVESSPSVSTQNRSHPLSNAVQPTRTRYSGSQSNVQSEYTSTTEVNRLSVNRNVDTQYRNGNGGTKTTNGVVDLKFSTRFGEGNYQGGQNPSSTPSYTTSTSTPRTTRRRPSGEGEAERDVQALGYSAREISHKCGRPLNSNATPLILYGQNSTEGEWPWHVALYKNTRGTLKYICGGSLVSNNFVVTAAHCVTAPETGESLSPNNFVVYIGTASIKNFSPGVQIAQVSRIRVYPDYNHENFHNDIAILKTTKPIEYTYNVRPVCLWEGDNDLSDVVGIRGTVVGWGLDENNRLSEILKRTEMPIVDTVRCIYSKPEFFAKFTSLTSFCAGFRNGSSACNGDSGSGMVIARRDNDGDSSWYLRGLVSTSVPIKGKAICDPYNYIVFTDVAKYVSWIQKVVKDENYRQV